MSHIEILLPFGLPPSDDTQALPSTRKLPALAKLISRCKKSSRLPDFSPQAQALPHEAWLSQQFGFSQTYSETNSPPLSSAIMTQYGIEQQTGYWFLMHPVHFQLGYDHLIMPDSLLELTEPASRALFESAKIACEDAGKTLLYGDATTWFLRADDWQDFVTASPDMACGRNLTNWMPAGKHAHAWRKLLNDIQMIWHAHPVNAERRTQHAPLANGLWLWSGAQAKQPRLATQLPYTHGCCFTGSVQAYAQFFPEYQAQCELKQCLAHPPEHGLFILNDLLSHSLHTNWPAWQTAYEQLEKDYFVPLEKALRQKRIDRITLHLSNDTAFKSYETTALSLRKFWIRKTLNPLQQ